MLIEIYGDSPDTRKIKQVAEVLNQGGLVVVPTDTIYAFAASLNNKKGTSVSKIITTMGSPPGPLGTPPKVLLKS